MSVEPSPPTTPVILADDDPTTRKLLGYFCEQAGIKLTAFETGDKLLANLHEEVLVAIVDLRMPGTGGMECLRQIKRTRPDIEVIILTAVNEAREAVAALREGAFEYLTKPFEAAELIPVVKNALRLSGTNREKEELRHSVGFSGAGSDLVAVSPASRQLMADAERVAAIDATVLLQGESGTGKSALARNLHRLSPRASGPFIEVHCPALPRELLESEMFGHEKGAFTGAYQRRIGRAELADGGTLFLDEISDLPLDLQPKLLRFLQEKTFQRIGGAKDIKSNVRVITATHADLRSRVGTGQFREDLYFRLSVVPLTLPPLRQRREDLPPLIDSILERLRHERRQPKLDLARAARERLEQYNWPGNVRELQNVLERSSILCPDAIIREADLPTALRDPDTVEGGNLQVGGIPLRELEKQALAQTLELCRGNKAKAARLLGITEKSIYNKLKRFGMGRS